MPQTKDRCICCCCCFLFVLRSFCFAILHSHHGINSLSNELKAVYLAHRMFMVAATFLKSLLVEPFDMAPLYSAINLSYKSCPFEQFSSIPFRCWKCIPLNGQTAEHYSPLLFTALVTVFWNSCSMSTKKIFDFTAFDVAHIHLLWQMAEMCCTKWDEIAHFWSLSIVVLCN